MPYQCALHLFGLVDHAGLRDLLAEMEAAEFSLPFDPFEFYRTRTTSTSYVRQVSPRMRLDLLECLYRRGIYAQWDAIDEWTGKVSQQLMIDPVAKQAVNILCLQDDGEIGPLRLHPCHAGDPAAERLIKLWPNQRDIQLSHGPARLIVVASQHEALSRAGDFAAFPLAFDSYRPG